MCEAIANQNVCIRVNATCICIIARPDNGRVCCRFVGKKCIIAQPSVIVCTAMLCFRYCGFCDSG